MTLPPADPNLPSRLQKLEDYLLFSAAGSALGLAALSAYILVNRAALKLQEAWAAPLVFLIAGGVLIWLVWRRQSLRRALPEQAPPPAPRPPVGLNLLLILAGLGYLVLYALVAGVSLRAVYNNNHQAGLVFGLVYALLSALEALAALGLCSQAAAQADLRTLLLPAGIDLARSGAFWLGFAVPLATMGLQVSQLDPINAFLMRNKPWLLVKDVPLAAVIVLGLLYFLLIEGLLGQAAGTWERINRGQSGRAPNGLLTGAWSVIARWVLALALAYPLGGWPLVALAALLVLWQALYFGQGGQWPLRRPGSALLLHAAGPALIYIAGTLTWLGEQWTYAVPLAFTPLVFFMALAHAAGQQRARLPGAPQPVEAQGAEGSLPEEDALRSLFTAGRLRGWQSTAFAAAGFASLVLVVFLILAEHCRFYNSLISPNWARCIPTGGAHMAYFELGPLNGALLAFDLTILFLFIGLGLARLLRPLGGLIERMPSNTRRGLGWILIAAAVVLIAAALVTQHASWLAAALLVRTTASALRA